MFFVVIAIGIVTYGFYRFNHSKKHDIGDNVAGPMQYSDSDNYLNLTPMKHDIFKQLTIDIVVIFIVFFTVEALGGVESFFDWSDFLSFQNFRKFRLSIIGDSLLTVLGYGIYFQIIQPYFVNVVPKF